MAETIADCFTASDYDAMRAAAVRGMGRNPTPEEWKIIVMWVHTVEMSKMALDMALEGRNDFIVRDGKVLHRIDDNRHHA